MKKIFLACILSLIISLAFSQEDSLYFKNSNFVVGEIKSMERGILKIETDYSDVDFKIEWVEVKRIYTESTFLITLTSGSRSYGKLHSSGENTVYIIQENGKIISTTLEDIVYLLPVSESFWDKLYANIDLGFSLTKANNLQQFSIKSKLGYITRKWRLDGNFNVLNSTQDSADRINRTEGGLTILYFLPHDFYIKPSISLLSSTEQNLDLRRNFTLGMGKYLVHTNYIYWGFGLGVNRNVEKYKNETSNRTSWEGAISSELNLFDIGDFSLITNITTYPGITENGRWRIDYNLDTKYDLPLDFYISLGFSLNYDNRPASGANETDYIFTTGFGWEW